MRAIDADKLIVSFRTTKKLSEMIGSDVGVATWDTAEALLEDAPTIDAVPVVRCKDCKHYAEELCWNLYGRCTPVSDMDYCSSGERRESNETDG